MQLIKTGKLFLKLVVVFVFAFASKSNAQSLPIGQWKTHLPYQNCKSVTGSPTKIWAATDNGLFVLNKSDNTLQRITKIDGLADLSIGKIAYNSYNDVLFVGYENGNIDLIQGTTITNLPDIKRAQIIGEKKINNIYFIGPLAYVSVGFGIVVIDTDRKEVKDTYLIGTNGAYLTINDITSDGTTIFAATESGIYYASLSSQQLSNFTSWTKFNNIVGGNSNRVYNAIEFFNGSLVANFRVVGYMVDTVLTYNVSSLAWGYLSNFIGTASIHDMYVRNNTLFLCDLYATYLIDQNFNSNISTFYYPQNLILGPLTPSAPQQIYVDADGIFWEADLNYGLVRMAFMGYGDSFFPNGPITTDTYFMASYKQQLLVVPGGHDDAWNNVLNHKGVSTMQNGWWKNFGKYQIPQLDTTFDLHAAAIDPNDANHYFLGSWGWGMLEIKDGNVDTLWNNFNSTLRSKIEYQWCGISGMKYDTAGNLWLANSHSSTCLNVYKKDGSWQAFDFSSMIPVGTTTGNIIITSIGQKWVVLPRGGGIIVFDENGTLSTTSDDLKKKLGFTEGLGNIPGTEVYSMAEDQEGEIWVGTDKGIGVFYCASSIFNSEGCDASQILITQGGNVQILLENQVVTAIAVDGANRKWIGTEGGGVFLMSSDGQIELAHFTVDNSPLLSDNITSLVIDGITGEVFFGTTKGIISYMGEAIEGGKDIAEVFAFPNPVVHEYRGPIAITGLVIDTDIKITDVRGQVVFTTTSLGGRAIWDGNNFQGVRVATGVYLVFASSSDGTQKAVTKILLIN